MKRRNFLKLLSLTSLTAGCMGPRVPSDPDSDIEDTHNGTDTRNADLYSPELPVPESELRRGAPTDAIPAITEPVFAQNWEGVEITVYEPTLDANRKTSVEIYDDDRVIGVERDGEARAYPLKILNYHEVVNDDLDIPVLVTYCPLCGSGLTSERLVEGEKTTFGVSGLLWKSNLVMYDATTDSLWSQILAKAIRGEMTGESLDLLPSTMTTWGEWKNSHPNARVLLPPPESGTVKGKTSRNYNLNPYEGYDDSEKIGLGIKEYDGALHPKTKVIGIRFEEKSRAYPLGEVKQEGVVNDEVGSFPVVVVTHKDNLLAYDRCVNGEVLVFEPDGDRMSSGDSRWDITTGRAVSGRHEGKRLRKANERPPMFWFAWSEFNPDTQIWRS